jgi:predicted nucleotide-binding protein (sugar kinase/HSP70/actin superfamily)
MKFFELAKNDIIKSLNKNGTKIFYFENITKLNNPRHPLYLKIEWDKKKYL